MGESFQWWGLEEGSEVPPPRMKEKGLLQVPQMELAGEEQVARVRGPKDCIVLAASTKKLFMSQPPP